MENGLKNSVIGQLPSIQNITGVLIKPKIYVIPFGYQINVIHLLPKDF